jgi:uncharacterized protein (DUF1778 family)
MAQGNRVAAALTTLYTGPTDAREQLVQQAATIQRQADTIAMLQAQYDDAMTVIADLTGRLAIQRGGH